MKNTKSQTIAQTGIFNIESFYHKCLSIPLPPALLLPVTLCCSGNFLSLVFIPPLQFYIYKVF